MTRALVAASPTAERGTPPIRRGGLAELLPVYVIAVLVLVLNIIVAPNRFADYDTYLNITDGLVFFSNGDWFGFEAASNLLFLTLRAITGSTVDAIDVAHRLLGATYVLCLAFLARRGDVGWRGVFVVFGLFGPLLAFVTIRATPAYFLAAFAALEANRGRLRALPLVLAGLLFHVSAVLALPGVIAGIAQNRFGAVAWVGRSTKALVVSAAIMFVGFVTFRVSLTAALQSVLGAVPFLSKYIVYTEALDPLRQSGEGGYSLAHLLYMTVLSLFTLLLLMRKEAHCRRFRAFLIVSYAVFMFLQFSPVSAYRQSQFWMLPAVLIFPWERFAPEGVRTILLITASLALFAFGFPGVVIA